MSEPADVIDLGSIRSSEGFFLLRDHPAAPAPTPEGDDQWAFCSTFRASPPSLRDAVFDLIRNATHKVFITSFIIGDDELIELLAQTARRLTGGVYVISGLNEASLRRGLAHLADRAGGDEISAKVEAEKKRFVSLTNQGVAVRGHDNCHAKFVVVDDSAAWVGTANLETRAFNHVGEVGVVLRDRRSVDRLAKLFARMWLTDCAYELPAFVDGYRVKERQDRRAAGFAVPEPILDGQASVIWTDELAATDPSHAVRRRRASLHHSLLDVIDKARENLLLASYSLNLMAKRPDLLLDRVAAAVGRGVQVELLVRALNDRNRHREDAGRFHDLGVRVLADDSNHAKAAVADDRYGALFSANFDAEHGLVPGSGIEVGARLDGTSALAHLHQYLRHALQHATRAYLPRPTARELNAGLGVAVPQWPLEAVIRVGCDDVTWHLFRTEAERGPVTWDQQDAKSVALRAGGRRFRLSSRGGTYAMTHDTEAKGVDALAEVVRDAHRRHPKGRSRGVCTAVVHRAADPGSGPAT
ncbi:phosphatidylserine/phosphatidylglycerophosphate/cardiolipin synthase family protein [Hamadaea sp. NPDC051192]|uniref:phospholipase D-like domain-containing protein n=1 Tax=Hamadaea sp. NPDC051192 TaxID=3154940 RepID=UPI0034295520